MDFLGSPAVKTLYLPMQEAWVLSSYMLCSAAKKKKKLKKMLKKKLKKLNIKRLKKKKLKKIVTT